MDFSFEDSINKSMLFGYLTAPSAFGLTFQWLWMPQPRFGMLIKFTNKLHGLFVDFGLATKQFSQVFLRLLLDDNLIQAHKLRIYLSSSSTLAKLLPCCLARRTWKTSLWLS